MISDMQQGGIVLLAMLFASAAAQVKRSIRNPQQRSWFCKPVSRKDNPYYFKVIEHPITLDDIKARTNCAYEFLHHPLENFKLAPCRAHWPCTR